MLTRIPGYQVHHHVPPLQQPPQLVRMLWRAVDGRAQHHILHKHLWGNTNGQVERLALWPSSQDSSPFASAPGPFSCTPGFKRACCALPARSPVPATSCTCTRRPIATCLPIYKPHHHLPHPTPPTHPLAGIALVVGHSLHEPVQLVGPRAGHDALPQVLQGGDVCACVVGWVGG